MMSIHEKRRKAMSFGLTTEQALEAMRQMREALEALIIGMSEVREASEEVGARIMAFDRRKETS